MVAWDPCRSITDQFLATFEAARRRVLSSCFGKGIGFIWPKIFCPKCRMSSTDGRIVCIVQSSVFGITGTRNVRTISNFEFFQVDMHGLQARLNADYTAVLFSEWSFLLLFEPLKPLGTSNSLDQGQGFGRLNGLRWYPRSSKKLHRLVNRHIAHATFFFWVAFAGIQCHL